MDVNIPTEVLRSLVAIADTGSFTRAAEQVFRTQSAVSQQVTKLEENLGRALFERDGRRVRPTPEGESLLAYARRILKLHDEAIATLVEPDVEGTVRFGIPDDFAGRFLSPILSGFARLHPRVQIELTIAPSKILAPMVSDKRIDAAVVSNTAEELRAEVLRRESVHWATSPHHMIHEANPLPVAVFEPG